MEHSFALLSRLLQNSDDDGNEEEKSNGGGMLLAMADKNRGFDRDDKNIGYKIFICVVGAIIICGICTMSTYSRRSQQQTERERRDRELAAAGMSTTEELERQREIELKEKHQLELQTKSWFQLMKRNHVSKVLRSADFIVGGDPSVHTSTVSPSKDIEMGVNNGTNAVDGPIQKSEDRTARDDPGLENLDGTDIENSTAGYFHEEEERKDDDDLENPRRITSTTMPSGYNEKTNTRTDSTTKTDSLDISDVSTADATISAESNTKYTHVAIPRVVNESGRDVGATTTTTSTIPNLCAICLEPYEKGERIVWSNNSNCQHAFHDTCLMEYYSTCLKKGEISPNCPCCRQTFFMKTKESWKKTPPPTSSRQEQQQAEQHSEQREQTTVTSPTITNTTTAGDSSS